MKRVVITGLGPVSNIGIGAAAFSDALAEGRSGISPITSFDSSGFPYICAGEVRHFRPEKILRRLDPSSAGRSTLFAAAAARLAVEDALLDLDTLPSDEVGVVIGTTAGESTIVEAITAQLLDHGLVSVPGEMFRQSTADRLSHGVSEELGTSGASFTLGNACAASNGALGYAYDCLRNGDATVMVAGGAESVCRIMHAGFHRLGALAKDKCSPFDLQRAGLLTAEGGSALVLETLEHACARKAKPYAEVLGYAANCDALNIVAPDVASIASCIRKAHRNASVNPAEIDYICAHGTGTRLNDLVEVTAIRNVFGEDMPPISSIKSMLGHTMGAASGFGAIASALAIANGILPPTINFTASDPSLGPIDPVAKVARRTVVRVAQNNGFAFGGNNTILILGAYR
jgi:3-oxoacyl-[acyl-carrier-protein] synthase II